MAKKEFAQQFLSTFLGALFGFIFSICLFYFTESRKAAKEIEDLKFNVQKEIEYNITFLEQYTKDFEKLLREVSSGSQNTTIIFRSSDFQELFLSEALEQGILYKYLEIDEINEINTMLKYFDRSTDTWNWTQLNDYQTGAIEPSFALQNFEYDKTKIDDYLIFLEKLYDKFGKI